MADTLSPADRSKRMALIRSKDTKPELLVRKALWAEGIRFRLHVRGLPGKPDIVLPSLRIAIFVHGCYWHGHSCQKGRIPKTNGLFWEEKFSTNKARDRRNRAQLRRDGWKVVVVWECSLSTIPKRARSLEKLLDFLRAARQTTNA
jgi:DNA mismatch endonuclease Vsr